MIAPETIAFVAVAAMGAIAFPFLLAAWRRK